jgi:leucyl aminopeptidase
MTQALALLDSWLLPSKLTWQRANPLSGGSAENEARALYICLEKEAIDALPEAFRKPMEAVHDSLQMHKLRSVLYASEGHCVVLFPQEASKKTLGGRSLGQEAAAFSWGAALAAALLAAFPPSDEPGDVLNLHFSPGFLSKIGNFQESFLLGAFQRSLTLKVKRKENLIPAFVQIHEKDMSADAWHQALQMHESMNITRSFVNMPANVLNPETYETFVRELVRRECEKAGMPNLIGLEVTSGDKLLLERCGLLHAVGKGSDTPPRLLKLTYQPSHSGQGLAHVSLVGKGITFDSGGLDIKPSSGMRNMKKDMGGSAAALGSFFACVKRGLPLRLTCYLALAENMVSGRSFRPGDVIAARNGLTVEIDNTDAEGRLVLADALCMAAEENPDWILNLATLTGAARVSLGGAIDSLFSNQKNLEDLLFSQGLELGDLVWPMPLFDDYEASLDSSVADMVNSASGGHGGSVTAALFLRKFVAGKPWAHIDTYMWTDKPTEVCAEAGATAKCVRLVESSLRKFALTRGHSLS